MELSEYILKVALSLVIVILAVVFLLPFILRKSMGLRGFGGKGSFEVKKVSAVAKNVFIVELEIKGRTFVLCVSEKGADVIYREDEYKSPPSSTSPGTGGSGSKRGSASD